MNINNKTDLDKIYLFIKDFENNVSPILANKSNSNKSTTNIRGLFTSAGANTEIILKYILKRENLDVIKNRGQITGQNQNKPATLDDFIFTLNSKSLLPTEVNYHLDTIRKWRNHSAHGNHLDKIDEGTIEAVNGAFKSLTKWFYEDYLKGEYIYSQNNEISTKPEIITDKPATASKKRYKILLLTAFLFILVPIVYFSFFSEISIFKTNSNKKQENAYLIIRSYFNSLNETGYNAYKYFADDVTTFYTKKNVTPKEIDILRQENRDFIDQKYDIDKNSLTLSHSENEVNYWSFWANFVCFKPSINKFQSSKVFMEFGINKKNKITSIKQIDIKNIKTSTKKPTL